MKFSWSSQTSLCTSGRVSRRLRCLMLLLVVTGTICRFEVISWPLSSSPYSFSFFSFYSPCADRPPSKVTSAVGPPPLFPLSIRTIPPEYLSLARWTFPVNPGARSLEDNPMLFVLIPPRALTMITHVSPLLWASFPFCVLAETRGHLPGPGVSFGIGA